MTCPVCESNMRTLLCACGYDASKDYAKYPTLGPVGKALPVSALRARRAPKDALRCEKCGGTAFTIRVPDGTRICQSCGWSPDPSPHVQCTCGGRYFLVRALDGALMCPLCSRDIPLDELIAQVRPAPKPAAAPVKEVPAPAREPLKPAPKPEKVVSKPVPPLSYTPRPADIQPKHSLLDRYGKKTATITAVATGKDHTVTLYSDGTVKATGSNSYHKCSVRQWTDIIAIAVGDNHTVGLKKDGRVVACGDNRNGQCNVSNWSNVDSITAGPNYTTGRGKNRLGRNKELDTRKY